MRKEASAALTYSVCVIGSLGLLQNALLGKLHKQEKTQRTIVKHITPYHGVCSLCDKACVDSLWAASIHCLYTGTDVLLLAGKTRSILNPCPAWECVFCVWACRNASTPTGMCMHKKKNVMAFTSEHLMSQCKRGGGVHSGSGWYYSPKKSPRHPIQGPFPLTRLSCHGDSQEATEQNTAGQQNKERDNKEHTSFTCAFKTMFSSSILTVLGEK